VQCLHCGTEHDPAQGGFCAACGLWVGGPARGGPRAARKEAPVEEPCCGECGVPTQGRLRCPACGARLQRSEGELDREEQQALGRRRRRARAAAPAPAPPAPVDDLDLVAAPPPAADDGVGAGPVELDLMDAPGIPDAAGPAAPARPVAVAPAPPRPLTAVPAPDSDADDELVFPAVEFDDPPPGAPRRS
jgi:hypothetical protein